MKKKYLFLFPALLFTSIIIASEEPDDEINTKTPHDASKIIPGSEEMEKHPLNESNANCRIGRKRRRQSACSERAKMVIDQSQKSQIIHKKK